MKNSATSIIFVAAMASATTTLNGPKSTYATSVVITVQAIRARNTNEYVFTESTCALISRSLLRQVAVDQIQQRKQVNPDDVDKVPVKSDHVDRRVVLGSE